MADYGLKISRSGVDVGTATKTDTIIHSEANGMKIVSTGSIAITVGSAGARATGTIIHNLGFTPFFLSYYQLVSSGKINFQNTVDDPPYDFIFGSTNIDGTSAYFTVYNNGTTASFTGTAHYILFGNKSF